MPLTETAIRNAKPSVKVKKLTDAHGLQLHVFPAGSKLWRYAFRFEKKARTLALGSYPDISLMAARRLMMDARELVKDGIDPVASRQAVARQDSTARGNTFGHVADQLVEKKTREKRGERTLEKVRWLRSIAEAKLGKRPIADITAGEILHLLKPLEKAGKLETARRLRSLIGEVFRLGIALDVVSSDPTVALRGAIAAPVVQHQPAILDPARLGELLRAIDGFSGQPQTKAALQLGLLLALSPGELRLSKWTDIDLEFGIWTIEAGRMKMRREHRTPLPRQGVEILSELKRITGHGRDNLAFPSARSVRVPISENTANAALRRLGFEKDEVVAHGFRATFNSFVSESGLWSHDAIERQLSHVDKNSVRAAYMRADFFEERKRMMQWWADRLDAFRALPPGKSAR